MPPLTEPTDQSLIGQVQAGELAALDTIFARYHGRIFGYLSRWLGDPSAAEDIVQETFLRVLRHERAKAPVHDDLLPWLLKIARNLVIDRHRRDRTDLVVDEFEQICDPGPIPLEQLTAIESEQRLSDALATIAAPHREILLLRAVDDLDYRDIALLLGCTGRRRARMRAHRATAALRIAWFSRNGRHHD